MYLDFGFQVYFFVLVEADPMFLLLLRVELDLELEAIARQDNQEEKN